MDETIEMEAMARKGRRLTLIIIAFPIVLVGAGLLAHALHLGWIGSVLWLFFAIGMTALLMRATQARARATGCASPAMLRYNRRMLIASMLYMVTLFAAVYAFRYGRVAGPLLWIAALATALPVLGMVWAMGRLIVEESDEYLRSRMVNQALFGTGVLLATATVWGFLEQFRLVPHLPAWLAIPVFAIGLGLSHLVRWARS